MTQAAPTSDCEIGGPRMTAKYNNNDIQTIRPKSATDQVNTAAAALGPGYAQAAAAADVLGAMPGGSQQEKLQEIEDVSAAIVRARNPSLLLYDVASLSRHYA